MKKKEIEGFFRLREKRKIIFRKMKLLTLLFFAGTMVLSASSYSQRTKIDLQLHDCTLQSVLQTIEESSKFIFIYDNKLDVEVKKNIDVKGADIETVLRELFEGSGVDYLIDDKQVFLFYKSGFEHINPVAPASVVQQPQQKTVTGTVFDDAGETLPGVAIIVKGSTIGTITDIDGNFNLRVPENAQTLVFSFVGYATQEIPIKNNLVFHVKMVSSTEQIADVVVVGYGMQKKQSVVGAITTVTGDDLQKVNVTEIANALGSLAPGINTIQGTSIPGGGGIAAAALYGSDGDDSNPKTKINIRGVSTWNDSNPLILVDGVERSMDDVDANEIAGVSILKDASATAVFGVRGANGVILITTKRGGISKPKIKFDGQTTLSVISKAVRPLGSYDVNSFRNSIILNEVALQEKGWQSYKPQEILDYYRTQQYPELYPDVDWPELLTRDAAKAYKFNINIAGGSRVVKYFGSMSYLHEGGILKGDELGQGYTSNFSFDRFNFRSNLDFQFTQTTTFSLNLAGTYGFAVDPGNDDNNWRKYIGLYGMPPDIYPVKYSDGIYADDPGLNDTYPNPYLQWNYKGLDRASSSQVFSDLKLEQKLDFITEGLKAGVAVSYDNTVTSRGPSIGSTVLPTKIVDPSILYATNAQDSINAIREFFPSPQSGYDYVVPPANRFASSFNSVNRQLFYQFSLNYNREFGKHQVSADAVMNRTERASGSSFVSKREDWVGRVTYEYDTKYNLEVNAGYNGSEKFDRKYRFGFFPSFAGGWTISNEDFFKDNLSWWDVLRVRYSYGIVGSDAGIDRWLYTNNWVSQPHIGWYFGDPPRNSGYPLSYEGAVSSPNAHWEEATKRNFGIETAFFKRKLKANFELFKNDRKDILISSGARTAPDWFGAGLPAANLGSTKTHGYELELEYNMVTGSGIGINSKYTLAYVKDEVVYRDDPELRPTYQKKEGFPIGQPLSHIQIGIMQNWDDVYSSTLGTSTSDYLPGDFNMIDYNADGKIDEDDKAPYSYPFNNPQYTYSYSLSLSYKGFSASALLYGTFNVTVSQDYFALFNQGYNVAYPWNLSDSWLPESGTTLTAKAPGIRILSTGSGSGTYNLIDGSYLRLKNVELAYQVPTETATKLGIGSLRFYLTGYNVWQWSKLREDRETDVPRLGPTPASYPLMKRFTLGVTVGL